MHESVRSKLEFVQQKNQMAIVKSLLKHHRSKILCIKISGTKIISSCKNELQVYDVKTEKSIKIKTTH